MIERAVELREAGRSIRDIADELDVPKSTIGEWVIGIVPLEYVELQPDIPDPDGQRLAMLRYSCTACQRSLPWTDFWAKAKWPDGTMRVPQSHCKDCVKERRRQRRVDDPVWAREQNRRDWQRIKSDPDKLAKRRELTRENSVVLRRRRAAA